MVDSIIDEIYSRLKQSFSPRRLKVMDDSHRHEGHEGYRVDGPSHIRIDIVADAFTGLTRLERHRQIFHALGEYGNPSCKEAIHAIQIVRAVASDE